MASSILGILVTPVTELAKLLVIPLKNQVGYLVKYNNNIKELRSETEELQKKRDSAKCDAGGARRRGEAVNEDMEHWLKEADRMLQHTEKLLAGQNQDGTENSKTCCTNLSTRYVLSRRAVKLQKGINKLKSSLGQITVSRPAPPPNIEMMPTGDFEAFESTRETISEIIKALNEDEIKVIGVYGMGGVGKTSLIRQVAKYVKRANMFDEVVIATVSQNPDLRKIQGEIAEGLGLRLVEETEGVRSLRLAERLRQETRIFIILDDVWEGLELSEVGIPFGKDKSNCKIAITTRNLDICSEMYCNVNIEVKVLPEQDSWDLFKKVAGNIVESPEVNSAARDVARECGGLPIALVTLGRVLRNKEPQMWADAAYELQISRPLNIKGMHEKVFSCLKLSFEQAQNEESRLCYLYCSLFPEDYDVSVEDLLRYGIGEGLFSDVETVDEARTRVHSIINNLKASCLLLSSTKEDCVKMHDVFRDLAISIATTDDYSFMVKASSRLMEWPSKLRLQYVMRMSLIDNEFTSFKDLRECPEQLLLLLLQNNTKLRAISDDFFAGMRALLVLDLSNIPNLKTLPPSLSCLTNLRTLYVENNELQDGSALGGLTSLEILSLRKSSFTSFPEEIQTLTSLRLLDLTDSQVGMIPTKVISKLCELEELYMGGSYDGWELTESETGGSATLTEILSLEHLITLHIDIGKYNCLTEEITSHCPRLRKFHIHIGERLHRQTTRSTSVCFNLPDEFRVPKCFMNWSKKFLESTSELSVARWKNLSSLEQIQSCDLKSMKQLRIQQCDLHTCFSASLFERFEGLQDLQIFSCSEMDTLFLYNSRDSRRILFPSLTRINVQDSPRLTALWRGITPSGCFQSLQQVTIESCAQIKNLFPLSVAEALNNLQFLEISNCKSLETVICTEDHEIQDDTSRRVPNLETTGTTLGTDAQTLFPQLKTLKLVNLESINCLTQPCCHLDFPSLERISVMSCPNFKKLLLGPKSFQKLIEIKAERNWLNELKFGDENAKTPLLKCFTDLQV